MPISHYTTTIDLEDEYDIEVVCEYSWIPYKPAVLYGDYPQPAEGGFEELRSVCRVDNGEQIILTSDLEQELCQRIQENDEPEAEYEAERADYLYDLKREEAWND